MKSDHPDSIYPEIGLVCYEAECEATIGNREGFFRYMGEILEYFRKGGDMDEIENNLVDLVPELLEFEAYGMLNELFRLLDELGLDEHLSLFMELHPYRSEYLLREKRSDEHLRCTQKYFAAYEKDRQNNKQVTIRMLELRDRIKVMEREREKMRASNQQLESIALHDPMTNLANRTFLNEHASEKFEEAQQEGKLLGVELLDIDHFKEYNDTYGHLAGDVCIEAVAGVLQKVGGKHIFCGRYGGDEFMIVYSDMSLDEIRQVAEEIQREMRALAIPHEASDCDGIVTVSQGIFVKTPEEINREWDFSSRADMTLYRAKSDGRNCYRIATSFTE